jgi:chromate transporter
VVVGSLALMGGVTYQLGRAALINVPTVIVALASLVLLVRWKVNSAWLVLAAAAYGIVTAR